MAEEDTISFDNLTEASQHKKNAAILSRQYPDPDIQRIVDGFKNCKWKNAKVLSLFEGNIIEKFMLL